ncbi:MAG: translation initiation factor IF-2 N-terminal domain-containing protein [Alkalibacterium thalassium]|nr:translation initiation factor IF-2 N-terminal domain-containing protein [Alkalibacterium thalassium]
MGKKRVYEFAKENDVPSKKVLETAKSMGIKYSSHMSTMNDGDVDKLAKAIKEPVKPQKKSGIFPVWVKSICSEYKQIEQQQDWPGESECKPQSAEKIDWFK